MTGSQPTMMQPNNFYRRLKRAKAAFLTGSAGAASDVRMIDPRTGQVVETKKAPVMSSPAGKFSTMRVRFRTSGIDHVNAKRPRCSRATFTSTRAAGRLHSQACRPLAPVTAPPTQTPAPGRSGNALGMALQAGRKLKHV